LSKGVSFSFDLDPFANSDRFHEGMNDFLARFRIAFDQQLPNDLSEPRYSCSRYASGTAIKLLAQGGDGRVQPVDLCSAVLQPVPDISIPRRHCSKFNGIMKSAEPLARFLKLLL